MTAGRDPDRRRDAPAPDAREAWEIPDSSALFPGNPGRRRTAADERAGRTADRQSGAGGVGTREARPDAGRIRPVLPAASFDRIDRLLDLAIQIASDLAGAAPESRLSPQDRR